jgi:hypothetical protein
LTSAALGWGLVYGFIVIVSLTFLVDKAGDYLYHRGIAKPFYIRGYRLHHKKVVLALVPSAYAALATLVYLHYFRVLWYSFWASIEVTLVLAAVCLTLDFSLDAVTIAERRMNILLHHEWVYLVVPAYVFTHLVALV